MYIDSNKLNLLRLSNVVFWALTRLFGNGSDISNMKKGLSCVSVFFFFFF